MKTFSKKSKSTHLNDSTKTSTPDRAYLTQNFQVGSNFDFQRHIGNQTTQNMQIYKNSNIKKNTPTSNSLNYFQDYRNTGVNESQTEEARRQRFNFPAIKTYNSVTTSNEIESERSLKKNSKLPLALSVALPVSNGSLFIPEEPLGDFNDELNEGFLNPSVAIQAEAETTTEDSGAETVADTTGAAQPAQAAGTSGVVIRGPRVMWYFNGQSPANYMVSTQVRTNRAGGAFQWSVSPNLTLSSPTAARPTVTTAAPSVPPGRDAWIRVRYTNVSRVTSSASYRLNILAPNSLTHLRNVDNGTPNGYGTEIHYSIHDQFGTVLPRNVPLNEQFTGADVADFAGMNWPRAAEGGALVNPADWHDGVGISDPGGTAVPPPVAPAHADAAVAVKHWPGDWRIGSTTIGSGRNVSSVTWQMNRGFARHT